MTCVRDAAFAVFAHYGVDRIFGNPGSTELPMVKALPHGFRYELGLNEAVVMAMADGFARAGGRAALVNLHSSAGTGHSLGNLFTAYRNNAPIVVTAGQQARSMLPYDPFLGAERPSEFPRPFVKWACEPARAEDVPAALARAFAIALTPPMGPVFVSIPVDDWERECAMPALPDLTVRTMAHTSGIAAIAEMLNTARNPALVLGTGSANSGAWDAAIALAEKVGGYVLAAPYAAREVFPENHPQFAGFLPAFHAPLRGALSPYDAVLVAGAPAFTFHAEGDMPFWPEGTHLALLSEDAQELARMPSGYGVLGDVKAGLEALAEMAKARPAPAAIPRAAPPGPAMTAAHVMARIAALRPKHARIVEEAPTARGAMHDYLPIIREGGFFTCASGGLGYGLPAAAGVALAAPEDKVIALLGDGAAMYAMQGLYAAAQGGLNIAYIILNNQSYAALDQFAAHFGMNHVPGTDLSGIEFTALAEGQGVAARKVANPAQLDEALKWSMMRHTPSLLDIRITE